MSSCEQSSCAGCKQNCSERKDFHESCHSLSKIKQVISIVSGKGGVGKSMVTATLAVALRKRGYRVGILDADITGPSIPKMFGIDEKSVNGEYGLMPCESKTGIKVMSVNLLLAEEDDPVIWRGPVIGSLVKQFWTDVVWGELDYLLIDMPPGTGDVPLTVFQTIPLDGAIIVTSPQQLVGMIVKKSYHMAQRMQIPVLGLIENMSYLTCPDCGKELFPFGVSNVQEIVQELGIPLLARLPIITENAGLCDGGSVEEINVDFMYPVVGQVTGK